jgi:hypothetical protein
MKGKDMPYKISNIIMIAFASVVLVFAGCSQQMEAAAKVETAKANLEIVKADVAQAEINRKIELAEAISEIKTGIEKARAEFSLKFNQDDAAVYKVVSENSMNFKFAMPSTKKYSEKLTKTRVEMTFRQDIESVTNSGVAIANITIQKLKILQMKEGAVKFDFDSQKDTAKKLAPSGLIGESYKISIDPFGNVKVIDAKKAAASIKRSTQKYIRDIVSTNTIIRRHKITTLTVLEDYLKVRATEVVAELEAAKAEIAKARIEKAKAELEVAKSEIAKVGIEKAKAELEAAKAGIEEAKAELEVAKARILFKAGDTWSTRETPPFKMLSSKEFEKIYKLDEIRSTDDSRIAYVSMNAIPAGSAQANPITMMAAMAPGLSMDSEEDYTGSMTFDIGSGIVLTHGQVLQASTITTDTREKDKEPDVLIITQTFTDNTEIVK